MTRIGDATIFTVDQAIEKLAENPNATIEELKQLVSEVDASAPEGTKVKLLYGNNVGEIDGKVITGNMISNALSANNPSVAVLDNTVVAAVIQSQDFQDALDNAIDREFPNLSDEEFKIEKGKQLSGYAPDQPRTQGAIWDIASNNFVAGSDVPIKTVGPFSVNDSIFAQTELLAALDPSNNVADINGIPIDYLRDKFNAIKAAEGETAAINQLNEALAARSWYDTIDLDIKFDPETGIITEIGANEKFWGNIDIEPTSIAGSDKTNVGSLLGELMDIDDDRTGTSTDKWLKAQEGHSFFDDLKLPENIEKYVPSEKTLNKLGIGGDLALLGYTVTRAGKALAAGDTAGAADIIGEWGAGFLGGIAGGWAAGVVATQLASPLLLSGFPPAQVVGAIFVFGATIAGAIGGEQVALELYDVAKKLGIAAAETVEGIGDLVEEIKDNFVEFLDDPVGVVSDVMIDMTATFVQGMRVIFSDPLVFDLDGDGVELTSLENSGVRFDFDEDGVQEASGWVAADDGMLVYDKNGNGQIDDISELFGNETLSGYAELEAFDSNEDGVVDANDSGFTDLKIWQDLNQNGISEANELFTMDEIGIASIDLGHYEVSETNEGNLIVERSHFTFTDGTVGDVAEVLFAVDQLDSSISGNAAGVDSVDINTLLLPFSRGYGDLASWHVAMTLDSALMQQMEAIVGLSPENIDQIDGTIEQFLYQWAGVELLDPDSRGNSVDGRQIAFLETLTGNDFVDQTFGGSDPSSRQAEFVNAAWEAAYEEFSDRILTQSIYADYFATSYDFSTDSLLIDSSLTSIMERVNANELGLEGQDAVDYWFKFITLVTQFDDEGRFEEDRDTVNQLVLDVINQQLGASNIDVSLESIDKLLATDGVIEVGTDANDDIEVSTEAGTLFFKENRDDIIDGGAGDDNISTGSGDDTVFGGDGNDTILGLGPGEMVLNGGLGDDTIQASDGNDTYVYHLGDGDDTYRESSGRSGHSPNDVLEVHGNLVADDVNFSRFGLDLIVSFEGQVGSITVENHFQSDSAKIETLLIVNDALTEELDLVGIDLPSVGTESNDTISGGNGDDLIYALGGDDYITMGAGSNTIFGGEGDDRIFLSSNSNNSNVNIVEGGLDDDYVSVSDSIATIIFNNGDGHDTIKSDAEDSTTILSFGEGITLDDINAVRVSSDLVIGFNNNLDDSITITNYFISDAGNRYLDAIHFSDETVVSDVDSLLTSFAIYGTEGNDRMTLSSGDDLIYGLGGDDSIHSDSGNDTIYGGEGDDTLYGNGAGDMVFDGGAGSDSVVGINGNDTYIYRLGEGNDHFFGSSTNSASTSGDVIELYGNITSEAMSFSWNKYNDLEIRFEGYEDYLTIRFFFSGASRQLETLNIIDSNGVITETLDLTSLTDVPFITTDASDNITGTDGNDLILTLGGDDRINADAGDDTLDGGLGDNELTGGAGADVFVVNEEQGSNTTITDFEVGDQIDLSLFSSVTSFDTLIITNDVNNKTISLNNNQTLTLVNAAALVLTADDFILNDTVDPSPGDDFVEGTGEGESFVGGGGNDTIHGKAGNDTITGDAGADSLRGGQDNDLIDGGTDNDFINGNIGNDTVGGGEGDDTLKGGQNDDLLYGGEGNDSMKGNKDNDVLYGEGGTDALHGNAGNDTLYGGADNDSLYGGQNDDLLYGGAGDDLLRGNKDNDQLFGEAGNDDLNGNAGDDYVDGGDGDDFVRGGQDNDTLIGGLGNDDLRGNKGDDQLTGGLGVDELRGGQDNDVFVWTSVAESGVGDGNRDVVVDFGKGDNQIDLTALNLTTLITTGNGTTDFTGTAGEVVYDIIDNTTILSVDVDGDTVTDLEIELTGTFNLTNQDILI